MRETLRRLGYNSTLQYLEAMCELVLRETTLLPHPNPGLLSAEWIARLAAVSPSMGLMLETTNASLLQPGAAHDNAPDKLPAKRLRTIEDAGKQNVPFTTGLLIGIGESLEDRVDTLLAIRDLHRRYGHIQEVIVQNFRVKPSIPMRDWPEPTPRRNAARRGRRPPAHAGRQYSGAAEPLRVKLRRPARRRHQRLGRGLAADAGFHQPGKALAASGSTAPPHGIERLPLAPALAGLSRVSVRGREAAGPARRQTQAAADSQGYARSTTAA